MPKSVNANCGNGRNAGEEKENKAQIELTIDALKETSEEFYSDYNISMDRDMLSSMLSLFKKKTIAKSIDPTSLQQ